MLNDLAALYTANPAVFAVSAFVLGLVIGSFLNVVIYRLPIMLERDWRAQAAELLPSDGDAATTPSTAEGVPARFTLSTPGSACPACKAPIKAWQNIPVVSWLLLRGRCASCNAKISARYPLVELATGLLSAWVAWHFGFGAQAACALLITWAFIALTGIDIDHQLLPDGIMLPLISLLSAATGALLGILMIVLRGRDRSAPMPFGPYRAAAGWLAMLYGDELVNSYLRVSGLRH